MATERGEGWIRRGDGGDQGSFRRGDADLIPTILQPGDDAVQCRTRPLHLALLTSPVNARPRGLTVESRGHEVGREGVGRERGGAVREGVGLREGGMGYGERLGMAEEGREGGGSRVRDEVQ